MSVVVWLGSTPPTRSIRWLDGALAAAAKLDKTAIALAAGSANWLDLAADRARHAGIASAGVPTELQLDYLGWAQIVCAALRQLEATTVLVDEASRPERWIEVAAIAELLDAVQVTHAVRIHGEPGVITAERVAGREIQSVRVRGLGVFGVRIAGEPVEEYPTPMPSKTMQRLELLALGLDHAVLGHRALPPRTSLEPRKTVDRVAEHLLVHLATRVR